MEQETSVRMERHGYGLLRARFQIPSQHFQGVIDQISACGWHDCNDRYFICRRKESDLMKHHFLLIYTLNGCGEATVDTEKYRLEAGTLMIFPKGISHCYGVPKGKRWEFYWMHIGGINASAVMEYILRRYGSCVPISIENEICSCMEALLSTTKRYRDYELFAAQNVSNLLFSILRTLDISTSREGRRTGMVREIIAYMEKHYEQPLYMKDIASHEYLSVEHIIRIFREETAITPRQYLKMLRMKRACIELEEGARSVEEITHLVGYRSVSSFIAQFKNKYGITPLAYRNQFIRGKKNHQEGE